MNNQQPRRFTRVGAAIVIAALVISATALSYSSFEVTVTKTSTATTATTLTRVVTTTLPPDTTTSTQTTTVISQENYTITKSVTQTSTTTITGPAVTSRITSTEMLNDTAPPISAYEVANVTIGGMPSEIAVDTNSNTIYVPDDFAEQVTVLNATTYSVIGTIRLPGSSEQGIAVDPQRNVIYVPVSGGIVEINGSTNTVMRELPINIEELLVNPSTGTLYGVGGTINYSPMANSSGYLVAISEATGSVIANTTLDEYPMDVAIDTKTNMLYVMACRTPILVCLGAEIFMVNGTSHDVQSRIPLSVEPSYLIVDPNTDTVYMMGIGLNLTLFAINGASGATEYSSNLGGSCGGVGSTNLVMNTATDQIYAAFNPVNSQPLFLVIDAQTGQIANMLSAEDTHYVAFNPATLQVYLGIGRDLLVLPGVMNPNYINLGLLSTMACAP
jgi:DNA-binding beta-propeller fold protein YncE